jgi:hypothetical protein
MKRKLVIVMTAVATGAGLAAPAAGVASAATADAPEFGFDVTAQRAGGIDFWKDDTMKDVIDSY